MRIIPLKDMAYTVDNRRQQHAQEARTAAQDALQAARAELNALQQPLHAASAALVSNSPDNEQQTITQQQPSSSTAKSGSRKRRVISSDSEDEAVEEGGAGEDARMQGRSDKDEDDRVAAVPATGRTRSTAGRPKRGRGSAVQQGLGAGSLDELERELEYEEESLQVIQMWASMHACLRGMHVTMCAAPLHAHMIGRHQAH